MDYHGFRSVKEYENECARVGFSTRRVPFHKGNEKYFALVTSPQKTGAGIEAWALFTADETTVVLDGIISGGMMDPTKYMRDGLDVNHLGKLAAHGYHPDSLEEAAGSAPAPTLEIIEDGSDFPQLSILLM